MKRTDYCGDLNSKKIGSKVVLCGWVHSRRDHGGVIFIDLRDIKGIVQVVFQPEKKELFLKAEKLRSEYVLQIEGFVRARPKESINPKISTGEIEVVAEGLEILNTAEVPPFEITEFTNAGEETRLKYRYLDLRRPKLKNNLIFRNRVMQSVRKILSSEGFIEIETPFLTKSTPEGARDFLVPSRLNPGTFYALPQSPQLFKQILMISGFDKYFQIVRCFRDEDLRSDRQPEFTQIDLEMSFVDEEDVISITEKIISGVMKEVLNKEIKTPFMRLTYNESMNTYGTDKPDMRYKDIMRIVDITDKVKNSNFRVFSEAVKSGGVVKCISVNGVDSLSRSAIDELTKFVISLGAKGLAWLKILSDGILESPIKKFLSEEETAGLPKNSIVFFIADRLELANTILGALRTNIIERVKIKPENDFEFVWITDFPLFEWSEEEKRWVSVHHPFTMPKEDLLSSSEFQLSSITARAYDIVLNGIELGGGSIRIHKRELQEKIFELLKISQEEAQSKFGFLLEALKYGAPPHGGIALGFDRFVAVLLGEDSIRDVIAFPKTQKGICPLTSAPDRVTEKQLKELYIKNVL
ncbi:MAG: aspartate--tRNA ligase [Endomicrobiia bacterium]